MVMYNVLFVIMFVFVYLFGFESVNLCCISSVGKMIGMLVMVGGVMIMIFVKGLVFDFFWIKGVFVLNMIGIDIYSVIKGVVLVIIGCFSYVCFMIF